MSATELENEEFRYYHSNIVYRNGRIFNALGKEIPINKEGRISIYIDGKKCIRLAKNVIYEAFSGKPSRNKIITLKVANNYSYDNIIAGTRNEWNKEKRALTDEQCRMIRKEHDEPYSFVNSRGITVNYGQTPYLVLAKRYNCSKSTIYNVLNGEYPKQQQHKKRGKKNES